MKKLYALLSLVALSSLSYAQYVGVNTSTPTSTLDVVAKNPTLATETQIDGVLAPRVSMARAEAMGTAVPNGNLIFVNDLTAPSTIATTSLVTTTGFYYFDTAQTKWVPVNFSANDWHTTGNAGTIAGTNFLGTKDAQSLMFKTDNVKSGYIDVAANGNTGFGYNTMTGTSFSTTGSALNNIALGQNTLSSATSAFTWSNIAIGNNVLKNATDPRFNTAIGDNSQMNLTTGRNNVSVGVSTLASATSGGLNTAIGGSSMAALTTGVANGALGLSTFGSLTTGHANIALGQLSGNGLTAGSYNTIIGNYNNSVFDLNGNQQLNIGNLIYGTGLATGAYAVNAGTTSYNNKRVGIAVTAQPNSTLQVNGSFAAAIRKGSGAVLDTDYTLIGSGDFTLPSPAGVTGRIYNFVYDGTNFSVIGSLRLDGGVIGSYGINNTGSLKRLTVQSDGTNWVILY